MNRTFHLFNRDLSHWYKYVLIAGVLAVSSLTPWISLGGYSIYLLILAVGLIALLILMYRPILGFILIIFGGIFIPFSGPGGVNITILGIVLLAGIWIFDMVVVKRAVKLVPSRTVLPVMVFILMAFISFAVGQLPWYIFAGQAPMVTQLGGLALYVLSALTFLLVANLVNDLRDLKWITWSFIIIGGFYVVIGRIVSLQILQSFTIVDLFHQGARGSMFWIWLVALSFGQALLNRRLHLFWRIVLFGLVLATFYVAYFVAGDWKSGWVPPLVVIVTIIGVRYWRRLIYLAPLSILPAALLARQVIDADQYSYSTRLEAWQIVLEIAKANPITGLGFANYYWYTPLYKIRGWSVQFNSHSQYVDIIAQMGIIGLAIFLWLFWEIGRLGWWLRDRVPGGFAQGYVYGALGGLAGTLMAAALADWLLPFAYNIGFSGFRSSILAWIFLGGLVSLEKIVPSQEHI